MKIGIIGGGVVGKATARAFLEHAEVFVYDRVPERSTHSYQWVMKADLVFLCLPSPQKLGSLECDTSVIETELRGCANFRRDTNLVLRSTVPIGTTRRLAERCNLPNLVHSPEFLTARCANTDAQLPARNIVGNPGFPGQRGREAAILLCDLYSKRFPGVPCHRMNSDESEAVKLFTNGFFAVKVAFFNEVRCLADKLGLDWDRVIEGVLSDGRIAHSHTRVPGPDNHFGFGGSCLPKDLANLICCTRDAGLNPFIANAARHRNENFDHERKAT